VIVNLRGTHGSGKSTVARTVIDRFGGVPDPGPKGRPLGYVVTVPRLAAPLYVVGSYETACGGCDGIQPYGDIWPRVVVAAAHGHVLFEGALVSSSYGNIGRASEAYGDEFVFAFLSTPLDVCLGRVAARRRARGDDRPLDPKNTAVKYNNVLGSIPKIRALGRRVVVIDHKSAVRRVLELFRESEAR
jgi:hypothetical protein